jgi:hypothetical protein
LFSGTYIADCYVSGRPVPDFVIGAIMRWLLNLVGSIFLLVACDLHSAPFALLYIQYEVRKYVIVVVGAVGRTGLGISPRRRHRRNIAES